jgi:DNA-binding NarL/FixJ family response regulator
MTKESACDEIRMIREDIAALRTEVFKRLDRIEGFPGVMDGATPKFTAAQLEILKLICKGESNKHIGRKLNLPETTVKARIRDIMHKLTVTNRTQIAIVAARMKLGD